ncbi:hypothetical protein Y1Q_0008814 [Alligator mississippiensis]|uniref:Uncharacterized protein n=1 Tax=Alligator mississippiensis TaxID=8496 RepID=A0A151NA17_ALLMI|nr:hypothetical protein Y1Q_0008814 [Alligator mississippiensis]
MATAAAWHCYRSNNNLVQGQQQPHPGWTDHAATVAVWPFEFMADSEMKIILFSKKENALCRYVTKNETKQGRTDRPWGTLQEYFHGNVH